MTQTQYTENLFRSIDTIINERIKALPYDKTAIVKVVDIAGANNGIYKISPDDTYVETVYSDNPTYQVGDKVFLISIPDNNYQYIVGLYMREDGLNRINRLHENTGSSIQPTQAIYWRSFNDED